MSRLQWTEPHQRLLQCSRRLFPPIRIAVPTFGDLHVHTGLSFDAFIFGVRATPDDAYGYTLGEAIDHPAGFAMQLDRPLDFQAVTDHVMYLGMLPAMADPESPVVPMG